MKLITSASYVSPELQAEFGKLPPSFLPLGAKRLFEYQAKLLQNSNESIYLSLPKSFEVSNYDIEKIKNLNIKILFVPDNLTLGKSISYVLNLLLPIDESISILHGDTLFKTSPIDKSNSLEVSKVDSSYEWTYISADNKVIFQNKNSEEIDEIDEYVLSGYFNIMNPYELLKYLTIANYSFIDALKMYSETYPFTLNINDTWLDFGLSSTYFHSRKSFTTERSFNSLNIENGYVVKSSNNEDKLKSEIYWFENFPKELDLYIPKFSIVNNNCYKTEYLYLSALNELFVLGCLPSYVWKHIFDSIKSFLLKIHSIKSNQSIKFDYKTKSLQRLSQFAVTENIDLDIVWTINGKLMPSINNIIEDLETYIEKNIDISFIHGDSCFSNIMYDFKSNMIKVFDPRGVDFEGNITPFGRSEYDYAKLMHSCIGLYDFIISGCYSLEIIDNYEINFEIKISDQVKNIQKIFYEVFEVNENLHAIMIHLFLSMLPLHNDDRNRQYALLSNAFRLYNNLKKGV